MKKGKFEKFARWNYNEQVRDVQYYFRMKATNGRIICQSEGYNSAASRDKGIRAIQRLAATATVVDV